MPRLRLSLTQLLWIVCGGMLLTVLCAFWVQYNQLREAEHQGRRMYGLYSVMSGLAVNIKADLVQADSQFELYMESPDRSNRDAGYTLLGGAESKIAEYTLLLRSVSDKMRQDMNSLLPELTDNIPTLRQLILQTHEKSERMLEARQTLLDFIFQMDRLPLFPAAPDTHERRAVFFAMENGLNRIKDSVIQAIATHSPSPLHGLDSLLVRLEAQSSALRTEPHASDIPTELSFAPDMTRLRTMIARLAGEWDQLSLIRTEARVLGQRNIISASRVMEQTLLLGNQARINLETRIEHIKTLLVVLALLAALLCLGGGILLHRQLISPLARITKYVRAATDKRTPGVLPPVATSELDALSSLVERLSTHLHSRLDATEKDKQTALEACITARNELAARNAFLGYMGHEIRTPANSILGLLYLCRKAPLDPMLQDYLVKIQLAAEAQLSVLGNMLDFSRIETDNLALELAPFSLSRVLSDLQDQVSPALGGRNLSFNVSIAKAVPDTLVGDAMRLRQILHNLADNAIKYTERGGISIQVSLADESAYDPSSPTMRPGPYEVCLHFCVQDTGIGIPPDMLHRLFEPFQLSDDPSHKYASNGLGLSIAHHLAHMMRGRIWVRSQPQIGSEFHFTIICTSDRLTQAIPDVPQLVVEQKAPVLHGFRVLLVEDDTISSQIATELLESCGLTVTLAHTGAEAVRSAAESSFDLIFMDIQMPVMDGLEATRRIRALPTERAETPILAMTAHTLEEDRQRCFEAGMQGYIAKPIQVDELHALLGSYLHVVPTVPISTPSVEAVMTALDVTLGLHHLNGNEKLYDKLLRRFADSNALVTQEIRTATDASDMETAIRTAHTLKGVAASLGATRLHEQAMVVEQALKVDALTPDALASLQIELELAIAAINERLG